MLPQARLVELPDGEADHRAERKWQRRPHIELLDRQADEQCTHERPDDRADPSDAELPARAVGAQRGRIDQRTGDVDTGLDSEDAEPSKNVAMASAVVDVVPAKPIEATIGTAITKTIAMAKKRWRSNQRASRSEPTVPPIWIMAPASAPTDGGSFSICIRVGVHDSRKK